MERKPGSPPRMRGKLICVMPCSTVDRITPADAGKTDKKNREKIYSKDHPRGCGENGYLTTLAAWMMGSPPRMRGKRPAFLWTNHGLRITPADAGKTGRLYEFRVRE